MKKIDIIVPDRIFNDVNSRVKDTHTGGMTYYKVRGMRKDQGKASCH